MTSTDVRILGGYAVVPTASTLRANIRNDAERLTAALETIAAMQKLIGALDLVVDDSVIAMRDKGWKWERVTRRAGMTYQTLVKRMDARRLQLAGLTGQPQRAARLKRSAA